MVATAGSRRAEPSGTAHLSSLFILRSLLGSSSPCMPSDSFCGHLVSARCQPTYISAPGRQFVDEAVVWHVESTAWMRSLREQSSQLAPCATQTSRALHASCVPEHVCGAFGCWLLQLNWGGQQLEYLHLALLPLASHSGAIGSSVWGGAKVCCRRSKLELARPIGPIPRAAHRTSARFALSGTSMRITECATGICMSVCMRGVVAAAVDAAADRVSFRRDCRKGRVRTNACTKVR